MWTTMMMVAMLATTPVSATDGGDGRPDDCHVEPSAGHDIRLLIGCDEDECGIAQHGACWTVRFACYMAGSAPDRYFDEYECQDANQSQAGPTGATSTDGPLALLDGGCDNHGVLVNVLTSRCPEEDCDNHGVLVNLVSDYCGFDGTDVCVEDRCVSDASARESKGSNESHGEMGQHVD